MPSAGKLRDRIVFERRVTREDGYGNAEGDFAPLFSSRAAALNPRPTGGAEAVIDARLQGKAIWDCWVRYDSETATVTTDDRVVDQRNPNRVFNVAFAEDMDGHRRWLLLQLVAGTAT